MTALKAWIVTGPLGRGFAFAIDFALALRTMLAQRLVGIGETPARAQRRRTRRGAASSVARIALLFGLPASLLRLVRRSLARIRRFRQSLLGSRAR